MSSQDVYYQYIHASINKSGWCRLLLQFFKSIYCTIMFCVHTKALLNTIIWSTPHPATFTAAGTNT